MSFNVLNRKVHYWASFIFAVPLIVIIGSGILLQLKKHWTWVQPAEIRGSVKVPVIGFPEIFNAVKSTGLASTWDDITRMDIRADRGLAKVTLVGDWEVQIDLGTGQVLQTAVRRSDLIETIHDGSFFAGDWTKLGLFFPTAVGLLLLWLGGMWMWWVPFAAKRRLKQKRTMPAAAPPRAKSA